VRILKSLSKFQRVVSAPLDFSVQRTRHVRRLLTVSALGSALAGCGVLPSMQTVEMQAPAQVQAGSPVLLTEQEAARIQMANSGTFSRDQPIAASTQGGEAVEPVGEIDNLIRKLQNGEIAQGTKVHEGSLESEGAPDSLWDRIRTGFAMPELHSPLVARKTQMYLDRPEYMQRMFKRSSRYLYHIVQEIERRGMPTEIALLPFVESAMNPVAQSHAKASGLWQFIPSTGKAYDLKQNWWVDNRRDVVQSTRAALDYLETLHAMHNGDWFLALASYNWGEGSVNRAIRRNKARGRATDYLSLRMPRETRHYVPKLIALKHIIRDAEQLQVAVPDLPNEPYFVVLEKTRPIDLKLAARFAGMKIKDFVALNPAHNRPVISASRNNMIKLPTANLDRFLAAMEDHEAAGKSFVSWRPYTLKRSETIKSVARKTGTTSKAILKANGLSSRRRIISGTTILVPSNNASDAHIAKFAGPKVVEVIKRPAAYHRVKRRDTLTRVARRWGVSKRTLRRWNRLPSNKIRRGQRLLVRQPINQTIETTAMGKRRVLARGKTQTITNQPRKTHRIKSGQNLGLIARKYGVTVAQLRSWNGIRGSKIRSGQTLVVKPAAKVIHTASTAPKKSGANQSRGKALAPKMYKVRRGDNLDKIARRQGVSIAQLKRWNQLSGSTIQGGQRLIVSETRFAKAPKKTRSTKVVRARVHQVKAGDTLSGIAQRYKVTQRSLVKRNGIRGGVIRVGQKLRLTAAAAPPITKIRHRVRRGDTLIGIARRYGVTVGDLRNWNALKSDNIRLNQRLTIEAVESAGRTTKQAGVS